MRHTAVKVAKLGLDRGQALVVRVLRALGVIDFPVPPNSSMRKTSSTSVRHYYESGVRSALPLATIAVEHSDGEPQHILDFGCGVGRQLLHMTRHFPQAEWSACDVDPTNVKFVRSAYPGVAASASEFHPPLSYQEASFDLVYSVSVFSHLAPDDHPVWLSELARVTRPGGIVLVTTEGPKALRTSLEGRFRAAGVTNPISELEREGILYREYDYLGVSTANQRVLPQASHLVGISGSYGSTVLSPEHVQRVWETDVLSVVTVLPGIIDMRQDLVVLRRR